MKLEKIVIANASALSMAIVYVLCRILVALFPGVSFSVAQSWFHTVQINQGGADLTISSFFTGLVSVIIVSWIVGYIFGWSWEKMSKR